jgi:Sec-independent protein translocase protein TatA
MGSIGLAEILVVLVVAFVLVQPKDLLHFVRRVGKAYQQMKSMRDDFVRDVGDAVRGATEVAADGSADTEARKDQP